MSSTKKYSTRSSSSQSPSEPTTQFTTEETLQEVSIDFQSEDQETPPPGDEVPQDEIEKLAYATMRGDFGVGEERKLALGDLYGKVTFEVHRLRTQNKEGKRS